MKITTEQLEAIRERPRDFKSLYCGDWSAVIEKIEAEERAEEAWRHWRSSGKFR